MNHFVKNINRFFLLNIFYAAGLCVIFYLCGINLAYALLGIGMALYLYLFRKVKVRLPDIFLVFMLFLFSSSPV